MRTEIHFINEWNEDTIEVLDTNGYEYTCIDVESLQYALNGVLDGQDKYIISVLGYDGWVKEANENASASLTELLNSYQHTKSLFKIG